jgi:hypothetical protein
MANNTLDDLIEGIASAMIGAREIMEKQHLNTIKRYFKRDDKDRLIAITTKVMIPTPNPDDGDTLMEVELPLFSVVPLNSLRLEQVDVEFDAHLSEVIDSDNSIKKISMDVMGGGALGSKKTNCKVKITIVRDDPPEGLVKINNHIIKQIP